MQNAHIASCRGTDFEFDPNCGTYLEAAFDVLGRPGPFKVCRIVMLRLPFGLFGPFFCVPLGPGRVQSHKRPGIGALGLQIYSLHPRMQGDAVRFRVQGLGFGV